MMASKLIVLVSYNGSLCQRFWGFYAFVFVSVPIRYFKSCAVTDTHLSTATRCCSRPESWCRTSSPCTGQYPSQTTSSHCTTPPEIGTSNVQAEVKWSRHCYHFVIKPIQHDCCYLSIYLHDTIIVFRVYVSGLLTSDCLSNDMFEKSF